MRRSLIHAGFALAVCLGACSGLEPDPGGTPFTIDAGAGDPGGGSVASDGGASLSDGGDGGSDAAVAVGDAGDAGVAGDAGSVQPDAGDAGSDAGTVIACAWSGAPGQCITVSACAALPDHTSFAGQCPGPAAIECCIDTPSTADNPPTPPGYKLMLQSQVTPEMTTWAVSILHDPATYPMFATTTKTFGALTVLARVEWHPPDFQNGAVHRGVTLYVPV